MSIKIKVSYEHDQELQSKVIPLLGPAIKEVKYPKKQEGKYKKVYITLE